MSQPTVQTTIGQLIEALFEEYTLAYGDSDLAAVAVAATVNDMLINEASGNRGSPIPLEGEKAA